MIPRPLAIAGGGDPFRTHPQLGHKCTTMSFVYSIKAEAPSDPILVIIFTQSKRTHYCDRDEVSVIACHELDEHGFRLNSVVTRNRSDRSGLP